MSGEAFTGIHSLPVERARVVSEFDVPASCAGESGVKTVGVLELTPEEELMATRRSGGDQVNLAFELAKQALGEVNGKPVSLGDGSTEIEMKKWPPQLRALLLTAYADVNTPKEKEATTFLKSRRIKV